MTERFEVEEEIGSGGMATVVVARDTTLGRVVAIKRLHRHIAAEPGASERFKREALSGAALTHPGIVTVYDAGEDTSGPFIVMELVRGETLTQILRRQGPLPPGQAVSIATQVAAALDHAHGRGVIHRDVKPGNILVDEDGRAKLADFGIAAGVGEQMRVTATGTVLGTVAYLAPERVAGAPATPASDLYALGVVMYEMITGRLPFDADSPAAMAIAHQSREPHPPGAFVPVPVDLEALIMRALAKDPKQRFGSAAELADELRGWQAGAADTVPYPASPDPTPTLPMPATSSRPLAAAEHRAVPMPPRRHRRRRGPRASRLLLLGGGLIAGVLLLALLGSFDPIAMTPTTVGDEEGLAFADRPGGAPTSLPFGATTAPATVEEGFEDLESLLRGGLDSGAIARPEFNDLRKRAEDALEEWQDGDLEDAAKELDRFDDKAIDEFSRGRLSSRALLEALLDQTRLIRELADLPDPD